MNKFALLSGSFLLVFGLNTSAEEAINCQNAMTTPEINYCAEQEWQEAEKKLNDSYKKLMADLNRSDENGTFYSDVRKSLLESQRAWITFRQKDCDAIYTLYAGGTIRGAMYFGCMIKHTKQRTDDFQNYLIE